MTAVAPDVRLGRSGHGVQQVYTAALGATHNDLAAAVWRLHCADGPAQAAGTFTVCRGRGPLVWLVATALRLPLAGAVVPLRLRITRSPGCERWERHFGKRSPLCTTQQAAGPGRIEEQVGLARLLLDASVDKGALLLRQAGVALVAGRIRMALPRRLCPRTTARAAPASRGRVAIIVRVVLPRGRLLVTYAGVVEQEDTP